VLNNSVSESVQCISVKCCILDSDLLDLVQLVVYTKKGVEMETLKRRTSWEMDSSIQFDRWSIVFI